MRGFSNRLIATAIVFAGVAAPLQASLANGAVAIAQGSNGTWAYGTSYNQPSVDDAVSVALDYCRNNTLGIGGCKIITTFSNTCAAIAIQSDGGGNAYGWATNERLRAARRTAMTRCYERTDSCAIRKAFCDNGPD